MFSLPIFFVCKLLLICSPCYFQSTNFTMSGGPRISFNAVDSALSSLKNCQSYINSGMDVATQVALDLVESYSKYILSCFVAWIWQMSPRPMYFDLVTVNVNLYHSSSGLARVFSLQSFHWSERFHFSDKFSENVNTWQPLFLLLWHPGLCVSVIVTLQLCRSFNISEWNGEGPLSGWIKWVFIFILLLCVCFIWHSGQHVLK